MYFTSSIFLFYLKSSALVSGDPWCTRAPRPTTTSVQRAKLHHPTMSRFLLAGAGTAALYFTTLRPVLNEPKRRFYENDTASPTVPGQDLPASETQYQQLAPQSVVNGVTVRSTPQVELVFRSVRRSLHDAYSSSMDYLYDKRVSVHEAERQVSSTMAGLHNRREDLLPNTIYVAIAALSGNIAARRRGLMAKAVLPVGFGVAAFRYFMPETFANTTQFLWRVEQKSMPELAQQQVLAFEKAGALVTKLEGSAAHGKQRVADGVEGLRHSISRATGLNIDEEVSKK